MVDNGQFCPPPAIITTALVAYRARLVTPHYSQRMFNRASTRHVFRYASIHRHAWKCRKIPSCVHLPSRQDAPPGRREALMLPIASFPLSS